MNYHQNEYIFSVPLDYTNPGGRKIEIFAREVFKLENHQADVLLYFQGGPGFPCTRDIENTAWIQQLLKQFRVVLLDQRGTGRSSKICIDHTHVTAEILSYFRADSIVKDAEQLRQRYFDNQPWFILGQSFGGFVALHYLSAQPDALKGMMTTGGMPPMPYHSVKTVYQHLASGIVTRNQRLYKRFPKLASQVERVIALLQQQPYDLGDGGFLTASRLLDIGLMLGRQDSDYQLAMLFDDPFVDSRCQQLHWGFVKSIIDQLSYEANPLYAMLHESIYCHGFASQWAADQVLQSIPDFNIAAQQPYFYGETIRQAMFSEYGRLQPFAQIANQLAQKADWPVLYDIDQLSRNKVPVVALLYHDDYYVNYPLSLETANAIANCQVLTSRVWQHDALRVHAKAVINRLLKHQCCR